MIMTNFMKAPPEKQRAIINAGFLCFGQNGYQKTSAADVAKAAGISKASLFTILVPKEICTCFCAVRHSVQLNKNIVKAQQTMRY